MKVMSNHTTRNFKDNSPVLRFNLTIHKHSIASNHGAMFIRKIMCRKKILNNLNVAFFKLRKAFVEPWVSRNIRKAFFVFHRQKITREAKFTERNIQGA